MKNRHSHLLIVCLLVLMAPSLNAATIRLSDLVGSNGFVIGDKWFHDFWAEINTIPENPNNCPGCIILPNNLNQIGITPASWGNDLYGFHISGGMLVYNANGAASIDIAIGYAVTVLDEEAYRDLYITDYHLYMGGYGVVGNLGFITVAENFFDSNRQPIGDLFTIYDGRGGLTDIVSDSLVFDTPQKSIYVIKDINISVSNAFAIISVIDQYASQNGTPPIPEPATVSFLGLGLLAVGITIRKKLF